MKKALGLIAASLLLAAPALAADAPTYNCDYQPSCEVAPGIYGAMGSPAKSKFDLTIGGYVKLDYAYNSASFGANLPAEANDQAAAPRKGSAAYQQDQSVLTARQSRFWIQVNGPTFLGAKTGALIEADFRGRETSGAGSLGNEDPLMRMRHAYGTLDWANTQVLFGQTQDIFGPALMNTVDFGTGKTTGAPNTPRVPQLRLTQKVPFNSNNSLKLVLGVQNPVQDGVTDIYGSANNYGSMVNFAGQAMFLSNALGKAPGYYGMAMNPLTIGAFGQFGSSKVQGSHAIDAYGYGLYAFVPVLGSKDGKSRAMTMSLEAQAYIAAGLTYNGANSQQTVGTLAINQTAAKGYGLYGQAILYPTQDLGITAGYGRRNALKYSDYDTTFGAAASTNQRYNEIIYTNVAYDLNAAVRVAAEYEHMKTQFGAATAALSSIGQDNTIRLAMYYFF
jgi:hypothetical protein